MMQKKKVAYEEERCRGSRAAALRLNNSTLASEQQQQQQQRDGGRRQSGRAWPVGRVDFSSAMEGGRQVSSSGKKGAPKEWQDRSPGEPGRSRARGMNAARRDARGAPGARARAGGKNVQRELCWAALPLLRRRRRRCRQQQQQQQLSRLQGQGISGEPRATVVPAAALPAYLPPLYIRWQCPEARRQPRVATYGSTKTGVSSFRWPFFFRIARPAPVVTYRFKVSAYAHTSC
ncbi:hypothetical protein HPB50_015764 [Hyalomma asiaticum]|uniref:Uncharacterized protein n=1 Tax=Hyalomma asiaticum TaxID=266040 RepID=A0ACB7SWV8_HYAAI|nr:hypothetical protein HPB50_015764 [Hyalomma asiaticum]